MSSCPYYCRGEVEAFSPPSPILRACVASLQQRQAPSDFTSEGSGNGVRMPGPPLPLGPPPRRPFLARAFSTVERLPRAPRFLSRSGSASLGGCHA